MLCFYFIYVIVFIFRKGFLYKYFVMSAILAEGVKPTLSELERCNTKTASKLLIYRVTHNPCPIGYCNLHEQIGILVIIMYLLLKKGRIVHAYFSLLMF